MKKRFKVGIFDSGIGGLTVLKECVRFAPQARYFYYGDNARAPYGSRSEDEIRSFTREALRLFQRKRTDAVVIACNTATAVAVDEMRREFRFPIIGVEPAVKPAAEHCKNVLVLATERTAESARMKMLSNRFPDCSFRIFPCINLAGAIEKYFVSGERFLLSAHLPSGSYDGVVLGCTHYAFFGEQISSFYSAPVYDGSGGVAKRLVSVLESIGLGRSDHLLPTSNPNICFSFSARKRVKFIGKCRKINQKVFFQTFVLEKTEKK